MILGAAHLPPRPVGDNPKRGPARERGASGCERAARRCQPQVSAIGFKNQSSRTPGITRRPEPLLLMKSVVSAVGCMPLLDCVLHYHLLNSAIKALILLTKK